MSEWDSWRFWMLSERMLSARTDVSGRRVSYVFGCRVRELMFLDAEWENWCFWMQNKLVFLDAEWERWCFWIVQRELMFLDAEWDSYVFGCRVRELIFLDTEWDSWCFWMQHVRADVSGCRVREQMFLDAECETESWCFWMQHVTADVSGCSSWYRFLYLLNLKCFSFVCTFCLLFQVLWACTVFRVSVHSINQHCIILP